MTSHGDGELAPDRAALLALAAKYEQLARLRRARAGGADVAPRRELADLARAFPGALRELDCLPLEAIDARALALADAAARGAPAAWMTWLHAYHLVLRAALAARAAMGARPALDEDAAAAIADVVATREGAPIDGAFVRALATPPRPRPSAVARAFIVARLGQAPLADDGPLVPSLARRA